MSKCLRCGAGSEWLEGNVPAKSNATINSLRSRLAKASKMPNMLLMQATHRLGEIRRLEAEIAALRKSVQLVIEYGDTHRDEHAFTRFAYHELKRAATGKGQL